MQNLIINEQKLTMSTREIATMLDKQHSHLKISAERLASNGVIGTLSVREFTHNGNIYTEYLLEKRDSLILVAQNCPEFTAKIIDRWQELEAKVAKPMTQIEVLLASVQMLADVEKRTAMVELQTKKVENKLTQIDDKFTSKIEDVKQTNLLTACPSNAEPISSIRKRMNAEYGLSSQVVDEVMRQSPYSIKPLGIVRNQNEKAGGSTYSVFNVKDVNKVFKQFIQECKPVSQSYFTHHYIDQKFKIKG